MTESLIQFRPTDAEIVDYVHATYSEQMADEVEKTLKLGSVFGRFVRRSLMREMAWKATNV